MRKFAAAAALAVLAFSPSAALDWTNADPVAQVRTGIKDASFAPARRPGGGGGGAPGQFDNYVFSLEWTPAFCEGKGGLPECSGMSGRFDATHLALHGLWPDQSGDSSHSYGYCGVDSQTRSLDKGSTWCRMPDIGLSGGTLSRLTTDMPGVASCLQNHEWYKHGSCSGYSADEYFTRAAELVERVAASSFGRFLAEHAGQTVNASDLRAAFDADFGAGLSSRLSLSCTKAHGDTLLLDVRMHLAHPLTPASDLGKMILPGAGSGNCPSSFLLDPAPSR
jgi:ribonuclease T2